MDSYNLKIFIELLNKEEFIKINTAADLLNISSMTIRRYINKLANDGLVEKVYGGVVLKSHNQIPINYRISQGSTNKIRIAQLAIQKLQNGDTIIIDAGSTCHYFAQQLPDELSLIVITHSLDIMNIISNKKNITSIMIGGELNHRTGSFVGPKVEEAYSKIRADKCFLGIGALTIINDIYYDISFQEIGIKKIICNCSNIRYILAENSKKNIIANYPAFSCSDITEVLTD